MAAGGEYVIDYKSKSDVFRLWCLGDLHLGSKACCEGLLQKHIGQIKNDPRAYWLGMGDYAEFIGYTDKRFDPDAVAEHVKVKDLKKLGKHLMQRVGQVLEPIGDKCIGLLCGNHEKKYEAHKEQADLTQELADRLKATFHGYWTAKHLIFRYRPTTKCKTSHLFKIFAHHGSGYATTPGGKLNKLIVAWTVCPTADMTLLAHVHEPLAHPNISLNTDERATRMIQHRNLGVTTGSYLKTYSDEVDTYGAQKLYRPVDLGAKIIEIKPYYRELHTWI